MRSINLKSIIAFGLLVLCFSGKFFSQETGKDCPACSSLSQNVPNPFKNTTTIKFLIKEDCYVKLYVTEQQSGKKILLVDGEMSAGEHGIIFKAPGNTGSGSEHCYDYKCILEAYTSNGDKLLNTSEIKMMQR